MPQLPHDTARCEGYMSQRGIGGTGHFSGVIVFGRVDCVRCLRRTAGPSTSPQGTWHMAPPKFIDGRCPERIAP